MSSCICTVIDSFCFCNPNGITCGYAAFDLLLQNSSITKRCFVILSEAKNLNANHWKEMFRYAQHDSNVIQSTTRVPVILSIAKELKTAYLSF